MTSYGPWLTAPDRVVRFGYLGDFSISDGSSYRTSTDTIQQTAAEERGFSGIVTTTTATPFAGHSYDGTNYEFQRAHIAVTIHPGADDSYIPSPPPPHAVWEFEGTGIGTVVGDLTLIITPLGYTGGATTTQFNYGFFEIGTSNPPPTIDGTFNYGATTPLTVTQAAGSPLVGGGYPANLDVWDTLQADGAAAVTTVEAGFVQVATAVVATIHPPRYRAVYDVLPPLRQYPRDDSLGGAPRQGNANGSTSVQSSARQGWKNVYR